MEKENKEDLSKNRQKCVVYSRVVGWYAPIHNFNKGKKEEFKDRKMFNLIKSIKNKKERK